MATLLKLKAVVLLVLASLFSFSLSAQTSDYQAFNAKHYNSPGHVVKKDDFKFHQLTVSVIRLQNNNTSAKDFSCRGWVLVFKNKTLVDSVYYGQMDANGGNAGLYVPQKQPLAAYFMVTKLGDYDGQIIVIDSTGKIKTDVGGNILITPDKKYVYAEYSTDIGFGLSVFNVSKNSFEFSCDTTPTLTGWFNVKGKTYGLINADDAEDEDEDEEDAPEKTKKPKVQVLYYDEKQNRVAYTFLNPDLLTGEIKRVTYQNFEGGCCCE